MMLEGVEAFFNFVTERESIRLRKEAGISPLTTDPILREYKFTNVRRHHDWTSTQLRNNLYKKHFSYDHKSILMMCAFARYFGRFEFINKIGWIDFEKWHEMSTQGGFERIKSEAEQLIFAGEKVFTGAYVITNQGISAPKYEVVVDYFLKDLHKNAENLVAIAKKTGSWEAVAKEMMKINGFGGTGFMTKEILLDTMYTGFWGGPPLEQDGTRFTFPNDYGTWTPIGPGARRGAARVNGHTDMSSPEAKKYSGKTSYAEDTIRFLTESQTTYWKHEGSLAPTDIQFQLCEFDKYERVRLGQGRPRSKYRPR